MFISKKFLSISIVVLLLASCAEKSDFPKLRAVPEGADLENNLIVPEELKPEVKYESSLDAQKIAKDEEELVIIASSAKKEESISVKPVMKNISAKDQVIDRNAITPRGVVKVHSKYQDGMEVVKPESIEVVASSSQEEAVEPITPVYDETFQPSVTYQLETFYFDDGSYSLKASDKNKIKEIVKLAKEKKAMIYVIGYSSSRTRDMDYVSHKMANFKVSLKRAENVADAIIKAGLKEKQVMLEALSDGRPAYLEVMPEGERLNRRVEIYIGY